MNSRIIFEAAKFGNLAFHLLFGRQVWATIQ